MTKRDKIITALADLLGDLRNLEHNTKRYKAVADAIVGSPRQPAQIEDMGCIPEFLCIREVNFVLSQLPQRTQRRWQTLYPDAEWLKSELIKAVGYYEDNGRRAPKSPQGWSQAISSWLSRGWEWHRKRGGGGDDLAAVRAKYDPPAGTLI